MASRASKPGDVDHTWCMQIPGSNGAASSTLVDDSDGLVSARIFNDLNIHELESERIFGRSWLFVAHESEIPRPGDYVTRSMGADPVIAVRGSDGRPRVLLNVCRHRGRKLCAEDAGNASHFRCGYHGWTYSNCGDLTGVPFLEAYAGKLDKSSLGLYAAPKVDSCHGLIFASWSPDAPSLDEYLGEVKWMLDILFGRTASMEVTAPMRWRVNANWKLGAANFSGDGSHLPITHGYGTALGLDASRGRREGYVLHTAEGHCAQMRYCPPGTIDTPPYMGLPKELWAEVDSRLSPEQVDVANSHSSYSGNIFPNLSFLCVSTVGFLGTEWNEKEKAPSDGVGTSFLTLRQWQPLGPDSMEAWSWLVLDAAAPESWKAESRRCYERAFGLAGMHEQDDIQNWIAITEGVRGPVAQRLWLNYQMSMRAEPSPDWKGPGMAVQQRTFSEINERAFYRRWRQLVEG